MQGNHKLIGLICNRYSVIGSNVLVQYYQHNINRLSIYFTQLLELNRSLAGEETYDKLILLIEISVVFIYREYTSLIKIYVVVEKSYDNQKCVM